MLQLSNKPSWTCQRSMTPHTQDVNWTYIRPSEDVQDIFWTS